MAVACCAKAAAAPAEIFSDRNWIKPAAAVVFGSRGRSKAPSGKRKGTKSMRKVIVLTTALLLSTTPAHAQLLGGGLGGALGGSLGGSLNGAGSIGSTLDSVRSSSQGTLDSTSSTHGSQSVNRRTGQVHADRTGSASATGGGSQLMSSPRGMLGGNLMGSASGNATGSADGQLIGTDAVRSAAGNARSRATGMASGAASRARNGAGMAAGRAGSMAGNASAMGNGAASGAGGLAGGPLGLAGNAAGSGSGAASGPSGGAAGPLDFAAEGAGSGSGGAVISRGAPVFSPSGERIGKVRQVMTNGQGQIQQMLVDVHGTKAMLPASNFTASGSGVLSAMSASQIQNAAVQQASTAGSATGNGNGAAKGGTN